MKGLCPTFYALKIARKSLKFGTTEPFKRAASTLNALWDSVNSYQESISKRFGAGQEMADSEELQFMIADALSELDTLENCEVYRNVSLREAVEQLERANGIKWCIRGA